MYLEVEDHAGGQANVGDIDGVLAGLARLADEPVVRPREVVLAAVRGEVHEVAAQLARWSHGRPLSHDSWADWLRRHVSAAARVVGDLKLDCAVELAPAPAVDALLLRPRLPRRAGEDELEVDVRLADAVVLAVLNDVPDDLPRRAPPVRSSRPEGSSRRWGGRQSARFAEGAERRTILSVAPLPAPAPYLKVVVLFQVGLAPRSHSARAWSVSPMATGGGAGATGERHSAFWALKLYGWSITYGALSPIHFCFFRSLPQTSLTVTVPDIVGAPDAEEEPELLRPCLRSFAERVGLTATASARLSAARGRACGGGQGPSGEVGWLLTDASAAP